MPGELNGGIFSSSCRQHSKRETSVRDGDRRPGDLAVSEKSRGSIEPVGRPEAVRAQLQQRHISARHYFVKVLCAIYNKRRPRLSGTAPNTQCVKAMERC